MYSIEPTEWYSSSHHPIEKAQQNLQLTPCVITEACQLADYLYPSAMKPPIDIMPHKVPKAALAVDAGDVPRRFAAHNADHGSTAIHQKRTELPSLDMHMRAWSLA